MTSLDGEAKARPVNQLRRIALTHRTLASLVLAMALFMKLLVPAGFMPVVSGGHIAIAICSGTGPMPMDMKMTMPGMTHGNPDHEGHHGKADSPCAFSGLSAPSMAAADPLLLAAAIRFAMAAEMRFPAPLASVATPYLRPPLRAPPTTV